MTKIDQVLKELSAFVDTQRDILKYRLNKSGQNVATTNPNLNMTTQAELKILYLFEQKLEEIKKQVLYSTLD